MLHNSLYINALQNLYFNRAKQPLLEREIARSCNILLYNELCNAYTFENIYIFINFFLFLNMLVTIPLKALFFRLSNTL